MNNRGSISSDVVEAWKLDRLGTLSLGDDDYYEEVVRPVQSLRERIEQAQAETEAWD